MKQYHKHLKAILERGTRKAPSREGMPGSISLFGYQNEYNLQDGFPILTTKYVDFKNIVVELLWFLRGDTNIKYLVDNSVNIWNEDAYNYYLKVGNPILRLPLTFKHFIDIIKDVDPTIESYNAYFQSKGSSYKIGDCGFQYGKVWRNWRKFDPTSSVNDGFTGTIQSNVDQIAKVITSLKGSPNGRRHIVTAIDPAHDEDLALYWCHCMFQFNTRELTIEERENYCIGMDYGVPASNKEAREEHFTYWNVPKYYLDCQLYQRSADMFLGVPYNISSYALLIHIIAKICNMIPGRFIHTFGDSHIYNNHMDQVKEILNNNPEKYKLPTLDINNIIPWSTYVDQSNFRFDELVPMDFKLIGYESYPKIKAPLNTGLNK